LPTTSTTITTIGTTTTTKTTTIRDMLPSGIKEILNLKNEKMVGFNIFVNSQDKMLAML
jgi:hypothetical protein